MSEGNVEIVKRIYAAWEQGDFSSADWADPDIEYSLPDPERALEQGVGAMARAWGRWVSSFQDYKVKGHEFIDVGDQVLVVQTFHGRGRSSGASIDGIQGAAVLTLRDGKVTRFVGYTDLDQAFAEAGIER
jgi:ketosteroid isomerase-like protein